MTVYPAQIDTTSTLPTAIDNVTPVKGDLFNTIRDAILAIESELGTKPSGVNSTVKARLNAIQSSIDAITVIELAGDLGGTVNNPKVIGLQGKPISSASPGFSDVLTWNGIAWAPSPPRLSTLVIDSDLNMDGYKIINLANPTTAQGAATKSYVDALEALVIKKDGSVAYTGNQSFGNHKITNLLNPTAAQDGATKGYVDGYIGTIMVLGGDLSGTTTSANVIKLRGNAIKVHTNGALQDGYALVWKNSASDYEPLPVSKSLNLNNTGFINSSGDLGIGGDFTIGSATPTINMLGAGNSTIIANNNLTLQSAQTTLDSDVVINITLTVNDIANFNGNVNIASTKSLSIGNNGGLSVGTGANITMGSPIVLQNQGRIVNRYVSGPDSDTTVINGDFDIMIITFTSANRNYTIDDTTRTRKTGDRLKFINKTTNFIIIHQPVGAGGLSFVSIAQQGCVVYFDGSNWLVEQKWALV